MQGIDVRVVKIKPMRIAVSHAFSKTPEKDSITVLIEWAKPKGLLDDPSKYLWFGHNNPPPSPNLKEYGYDSILTIGPEIEPDKNIQVKEIAGGLYAVIRTNLKNIGKMWEWLYKWVNNSEYTIAGHGLEEFLNPLESSVDNYIFDLWLPIKE